MAQYIKRIVISALALSLGACASTENPVSGQREFTTISRDQEQKIGDKEHPKLLESFGGAYQERGVQAYVADIGTRIAANSQLAGQQRFTFTVLDTPSVNAFAVPGGYVYITRGLMALAQDEAELAGVLGHEIGHVAARHTAQRQTRATVAGIGSLLATVGAAAAGLDGNTVKQLGQYSQLAAKGYVAQFSQGQELEADKLGVDYMARTGYNPYALADMLDHMQAQSALHARLKGQDYDPNSVGFFSTHPATGARARQSVQSAQASGLPVNNAAPRNQDRYMRAIDGMIYGDSPEQGYSRNGTFWHPDLGFAFDAPRGWEIKNTPKAVGVIAPDGKALAVLDSGERAGTLEQTLVKMVSKANGVERPQRLTVNGLPAVTTAMNGKIQGTDARIRIVLIDAGSQLYRFRMAAPLRGYGGVDGQFEALARSFRRISPGQAPAPLRIRTRQVFGGESVAQLAAQTGFDNAKEERFRVMNGLSAGEQLRPGQWIKLVQ